MKTLYNPFDRPSMGETIYDVFGIGPNRVGVCAVGVESDGHHIVNLITVYDAQGHRVGYVDIIKLGNCSAR
jgi:hypothetical protein